MVQQGMNQIVENMLMIVEKQLVFEMIVDESLMIEDESLEMLVDESLEMIEDESLDMTVDETLMIEDESLEMLMDDSLEMINDESLDMIVDETLKIEEILSRLSDVVVVLIDVVGVGVPCMACHGVLAKWCTGMDFAFTVMLYVFSFAEAVSFRVFYWIVRSFVCIKV
ncbi:hypothetical protein Tco_0448400 [Tanacetum coccineum]